MSAAYPIIAGAEPWSHPGEGARASIGVAVVHGFTGNPVSSRPLGEALAKHGFCVEVSRLVGHGTHWRDLARTRYADWRADVEAVARDLASRCEQVVLVGLSLGGTLVLDVACQNPPKVVGVVSINPPLLSRPGLLAKAAPLVAQLVPAIPAHIAGVARNDAARPGVQEHAYEWIPTKAAQSMLAAFPPLRERLQRMSLPLLAVYSKVDHSVPPENTLALAEWVAGEVTLVPLLRSYHLATLDYDRDLLAERVAEFVEEVTSPEREGK